ncbi:MAG: cobalt ECF transporter T component CbiQ [Anaerolineaceae bacterium]|nr:cobalt ECF transporter T component CbiQ [Anaerolineaceae bacterium]
MAGAFQERYRPGDSRIHRLDPRIKTVTALLLILGIVLTPEHAWPAYPLIWALLGSMAEIGGIRAWRLGRMAALVLPFTLAAVALPFTMPGRTVFEILGLAASDTGLARFGAVVLKSWLSAQAALLLTTTTPFTDLLWALSSLRVPPTLVTILGFTYRYLHTLKEEAERLIRARDSRSGTLPGQKSGGSLWWRAQVAGAMIGNLFIRSYERSERVYLAMRARGYTGEMKGFSRAAPTINAMLSGALPVLVLVLIEVIAVILWSS